MNQSDLNEPTQPPWKPWRFLWFLFCLLCGISGNFVQWGNPNGFHGTGFPISHVMWDRPKGSDHLVDFVNPYMIFVNVGLVLLAGWLVWLLVRLVFRCFRRERRDTSLR